MVGASMFHIHNIYYGSRRQVLHYSDKIYGSKVRYRYRRNLATPIASAERRQYRSLRTIYQLLTGVNFQ